MRRALLFFIAIVALALALAACGGSDDSSSQGAAVSTEAQATGAATTPGKASGERGGEGGGKGFTSSAASRAAGAGRGAEKPASLATDPKSIPGARVTPTGAVQTLPPSEEAQGEAMKNSYASIKAFGSEAEGSEASDITYALVQYLDARANGDWATACARLYSVVRENLTNAASEDPVVKGGDCPSIYGSLMEKASNSADAEEAKVDVASVRRDGSRAFVIYKTPDTLSADMPMYLEAGVWTVAAIEAYVLTPQQLGEHQ
jgi:hypothetical protein